MGLLPGIQMGERLKEQVLLAVPSTPGFGQKED